MLVYEMLLKYRNIRERGVFELGRCVFYHVMVLSSRSE